jgi:TatA/E family protein of Tat protein translocase
MVAFIQNIGIVPLIVIGVISFLIFGSKLPQMAANVGRSLFSFKKGLAEGKKELEELEKEIVE